MEDAGYTSIRITKSVHEKLVKLKNKLKAQSYTDLINELINKYRYMRSQFVRAIICGELSKSKAYPRAWIKILRRKGLDDDEIEEAFKYLVPAPDNPNELVVDREKCGET